MRRLLKGLLTLALVGCLLSLVWGAWAPSTPAALQPPAQVRTAPAPGLTPRVLPHMIMGKNSIFADNLPKLRAAEKALTEITKLIEAYGRQFNGSVWRVDEKTHLVIKPLRQDGEYYMFQIKGRSYWTHKSNLTIFTGE